MVACHTGTCRVSKRRAVRRSAMADVLLMCICERKPSRTAVVVAGGGTEREGWDCWGLVKVAC